MFEKELKKIEDYILYGQSKEALEYINELEKKNYSGIKKDILKLKKCYALFGCGNFDLAFELVEDVLPKLQKEDSIKYYLEALTHKARIMIERSKPDEALVILKQSEHILDKLPTERIEELYKERISLLFFEGAAYFHKQDYKRALKITEENLEIAEYYKDKFSVGFLYIFIADCKSRLGPPGAALDYREEALRIFTELKLPYWIAYVQHYLGHYYAKIGDYDKAIDYYLKIKPFIDRRDNAYQKIVVLGHLASAYYFNLDKDISYDYNLQAYQLLDKTNRLDAKELILGRLVTASIDRGEFDEADKYLEELKPIIKQSKKQRYDLIIQFYEIKKILKKFYDSKNTILREEAERKIREILDNETITDPSRWSYLLDLCSLLLHEYIDTGNNELIDEIETITSNLLNIPKFEDTVIRRLPVLFYRLIVLWLRAKINRNDKKLEEIQELLSKTEVLAGIKGNKLLMKYIKDVQEYYTTLIDELVEIVEKYVTSS